MSTTSDMDLTKFNTEFLCFERKMPDVKGEQYLQYPNKWFMGSVSECSCSFRHLDAENVTELGFSEPVEWWPEEPEEIKATLEIVSCFKELLTNGYKIDLVDTWAGNHEEIEKFCGTVSVNLFELPKEAFRLFGSHRMVFNSET